MAALDEMGKDDLILKGIRVLNDDQIDKLMLLK